MGRQGGHGVHRQRAGAFHGGFEAAVFAAARAGELDRLGHHHPVIQRYRLRFGDNGRLPVLGGRKLEGASLESFFRFAHVKGFRADQVVRGKEGVVQMNAAFLPVHVKSARNARAGALRHFPRDEHLVGHLRQRSDLPVPRQVAEQADRRDQRAQDDQQKARPALQGGDQPPLPRPIFPDSHNVSHRRLLFNPTAGRSAAGRASPLSIVYFSKGRGNLSSPPVFTDKISYFAASSSAWISTASWSSVSLTGAPLL